MQWTRLFVRTILLALLHTPLSALDSQLIFVLRGNNEILQYQLGEDLSTLTVTYTRQDFQEAFPCASIEMKNGNILHTYGANGELNQQLLYDPSQDRLIAYTGEAGDVGDPDGRLVIDPQPDDTFRGEGSVYSKRGRHGFRERLLREEFRKSVDGAYQDLFVLDGQVFGIGEDRIDRLSKSDSGEIVTDEALVLSESNLVKAAVSPWEEVFLLDRAKHAIQRVSLGYGGLELNGPLQVRDLEIPTGLAFNLDGELFVADGGGDSALVRLKFHLENFVSWNPRPPDRFPLEKGEPPQDLALTRPMGYVASEKTHPLVKLTSEQAGGHIGISQVVFVSPQTNSEAGVIALVEYEAGGYTPVHYHSDGEQAEVVISGRALWEVGEFEREVGPGDVIFCPRYAKHGYKVLGDGPSSSCNWNGQLLSQTNIGTALPTRLICCADGYMLIRD